MQQPPRVWTTHVMLGGTPVAEGVGTTTHVMLGETPVAEVPPVYGALL